MSQNVCFIGAGYIGGSTGPIMAFKNPDVNFYVVDISQSRIDAWNSDILPIYEPGLDKIVKSIRNKNLFFSTDVKYAIQNSEIIFIGVNTPTKEYGNGKGFASDLTFWEGAARTIAEFSDKNAKIVVEKSTLPVKTAHAIKTLLNTLNPGIEHTILSNPEFLAEGTAVRDLLDPDRILIGGMDDQHSKENIQKVADLYRSWVPEHKIITTGLWSSELSKLASNAMLAQRVSSINSFACVCEEVDADISEVQNILGMDKRIGNRFLKAGPGFGGSCFKKDILNLIYICKSLGLIEVANYWQSVIDMNVYQQKRIAKRILDNAFNTLTNKKVCVLGYSFKADTGDTRETPSKSIISYLKDERCKMITVYDPQAYSGIVHEVSDDHCKACNDIYEALSDADIAIVVTDWDEFKECDWNKAFNVMRNQKMIFDARNFLDHKMLKEIGFQVMSIGKTTI